jgi:hypothetical protein
MARRRRENTVSLNFDSLTDTITNLAGALILVVVLVLGMSRDAPVDPRPPPEPTQEGEKLMGPLVVRLERARSQMRKLEADVGTLESGIEDLRRKLSQSSRQVEKPPPGGTP